ncbi:MAG: hypothetical protein ACOC0N_09850, partial [Chroococcales cyanobacterium]
MEFGLDLSLATQPMGHSVKVHTDIYHHWISERRRIIGVIKRVLLDFLLSHVVNSLPIRQVFHLLQFI